MTSSTIHPWFQLHIEPQKENQAEITLWLQFNHLLSRAWASHSRSHTTHNLISQSHSNGPPKAAQAFPCCASQTSGSLLVQVKLARVALSALTQVFTPRYSWTWTSLSQTQAFRKKQIISDEAVSMSQCLFFLDWLKLAYAAHPRITYAFRRCLFLLLITFMHKTFPSSVLSKATGKVPDYRS